MAWRIEFDPAAARELSRLDPPTAKRILRFLRERVAPAANPRALGAALKGARLGAFWKNRVGDYRLIARIEDRDLLVLVLRVGNRRDIYR